jgi:hypothetical protein
MVIIDEIHFNRIHYVDLGTDRLVEPQGLATSYLILLNSFLSILGEVFCFVLAVLGLSSRP